MRLPRLRLTIGQLLFAIATVSVNCWAVRELSHYVTGTKEWPNSLPAPYLVVGFLPSINVTLIGGLRLIASGVSARRAKQRWTPRPGAIGGLFLSLQSLALCGFVIFIMPDKIDWYLEFLSRLSAPVEEYLSAVVDEDPNSTILALALNYVCLGSAISGPLLLCTWIGRMLAARSAVNLSSARFRLMGYLVSLGFAMVILAIALTPQRFQEQQDVRLDFQVTDSDSGRPVGAAFLRITDAFLREHCVSPRALTGSDGHAHLRSPFWVVGERNAFRILGGSFSPEFSWLEISAPHYPRKCIPLSDVMGTDVDLDRLRHFRVAIKKRKKREILFQDIAGEYRSRSTGLGTCTLILQPDGRFTWSRVNLSHGSSYKPLAEWGHTRRSKGELMFLPIKNPRRETDPLMHLKYRMIDWGDQAWLSSTELESLYHLCRAALFPRFRGKYGEMPGLNLQRTSDGGKPLVSLPRLPARVWIGFFLEELNLKNKESVLSSTLASLLRQVFGEDDDVPTISL